MLAYIETGQLIWTANQLDGFYMIATMNSSTLKLVSTIVLYFTQKTNKQKKNAYKIMENAFRFT